MDTFFKSVGFTFVIVFVLEVLLYLLAPALLKRLRRSLRHEDLIKGGKNDEGSK